MRAVYKWAVEGDGDATDVVPVALAANSFMDRVYDTGSTALSSFISDCINLLDANDFTSEVHKRAQTALRIGLGIAVHCVLVDAEEYTCIRDIVKTRKGMLSSEYRFLRSGGTSTHAKAFPFHHMYGDIPHASWRHVAVFENHMDEGSAAVREQFSKDLILQVLSYCDVKSICRAAAISKEWRHVEKMFAGTIWKARFLRRWPNAVDSDSDFKARFRLRLELAASRKLPLGRNSLPNPIFCTKCDKILKRPSEHKCREVRSAKKQKREGT